jgi:cytochrome c2
MRPFRSRPIVVLLSIGAVVEMGCSSGATIATAAAELTGGDPDRGPAAIRKYGCDSCHTIPGVATAHSLVGPPLTAIGARSYLGGEVVNTPDNMQLWIRHPRDIEPRTAMPDTGVTEADGRDIAAYLYTLR